MLRAEVGMESKCSRGWGLKVEEFEKGSCDQEVGIQRTEGGVWRGESEASTPKQCGAAELGLDHEGCSLLG